MDKLFALIELEEERCWIIKASDQHKAISKAVKAGFSGDMSDFHYGLEDGQISIIEVEREL